MTPPPTVAAEHRRAMLATREVGAWLKDHSSPATSRAQLDQLELFCRRTAISPVDLLHLARRKPVELQTVVQEYVLGLQGRGLSSRYAINSWWGIRSFLAFHGAAPTWTPKLKPVAADEEDGSETVPTVEQMRAILNVLSPRGRAVALLLASSGIRVGVLANQEGSPDGLRLKHLPDLSPGPEPRFLQTPFLVRVPPHLAKGSTVTRPRGYLTFGSPEAAEAIVASLKDRLSRGEKLTPESPLVVPDGRGRKGDRVATDGTRFMARKALASTLTAAMERVKPEGAHWHAHTLRAWFSTQMEAAESRGLISRSRREFFMGHSGGGVDFAYNLNRPKGSAKIEELRASYERCLPYLSLSLARPGTATQSEMARLMLTGLGYTEEELARVDFDNLDVGKFQELVTGKVAGRAPVARQKLVDAKDLPVFLKKGWTVVTAVNGHQVVLNPPAGP